MPVLHNAKTHPATPGPITLADGSQLTAQAGACFLVLEITPGVVEHVDRLSPALARTIPFLSVHADPAYPDLAACMEKAAGEVEFRHAGPAKVAKLLKEAAEKGDLTREDLQHMPEALAGLEAFFAKTEPIPEAPAEERETVTVNAEDVGKVEDVLPTPSRRK